MIRTVVVLTVLGSLVAAPAAGQSAVRGTVTWRGGPAGEAVVALLGTADGAAATVDDATIDQRHLRFAPRVVAVQPGASVEFVNSDPIMHNVFSPARGGVGFDLGTYPQFEGRRFTFVDEGTFVVLCHVHPEMVAWVTVVPSPLHAVTDPAGGFVIDDVPPGEYRVQVTRRSSTVVLEDPVSIGPGGTSDLRLTLGADTERRGAR